MGKQNTLHILMIRPARFGYNPQTAASNTFQKKEDTEVENVQRTALVEFDNAVQKLQSKGVNVHVFDDTLEPWKPDAVFPNNWISFHEDGSVILYPMLAENRRWERRTDIIENLSKNFKLGRRIDLSAYEDEKRYLEGTGSIVLDREKKLCYACISPRTDKVVLKDFCEKMGYNPIIFQASDMQGKPVYHTNVVMCVAKEFLVICMTAIKEQHEKESIRKNCKKPIIEISMDQMAHFAGNMLEIENREGKRLMVMSEQAYKSLTPEQIMVIEHEDEIVCIPIETIEKNGGGSARCMMAEIFLEKRYLLS